MLSFSDCLVYVYVFCFIYTISISILWVSREEISFIESNQQICDFDKWANFEKQKHCGTLQKNRKWEIGMIGELGTLCQLWYRKTSDIKWIKRPSLHPLGFAKRCEKIVSKLVCKAEAAHKRVEKERQSLWMFRSNIFYRVLKMWKIKCF